MAQQTPATCTECGAQTTLEPEEVRLGGWMGCPVCGDDFEVCEAIDVTDDHPDDPVEVEPWAIEQILSYVEWDVVHGKSNAFVEKAYVHLESALETQDPDPVDPDEKLVVVDLDHLEGREMFNNWGDRIDGVPVVREIPADAGALGNSKCEGCGESRSDCYRLKHDATGVPICLDCLSGGEWIVDVVDSRDELPVQEAA